MVSKIVSKQLDNLTQDNFLMQQPQTLNNSDELFDLLQSVCAEDFSGDLVIHSGEVSGKIYLIKGAVSWAFASGQETSFQSILLREQLTSKDALIQGIRSCREKGTSVLDSILKEVGIADADIRRSIIKRHSQSALQTIGLWDRYVVKQIPKEQNASALETTISMQELVPDKKSFRPPKIEPKVLQKQSTPVNDMPEVLVRLREEIPYFLGAMILDSRTGMPVVSLSDVDSLDVEVASAFYRDVVKSAEEAQSTLGAITPSTGKAVEEILITTENDFVLLQSLSDGDYILYVLLDKTSNPGMARVVVRRYLDAMQSLL